MNRCIPHLKCLVILIYIFLLPLNTTAQSLEDVTQLSYKDFTNLSLPPLDSLFDTDRNSHTYQLVVVKAQIERKLLGKERRAFLSFFSLRGSYQYGMFGNEATYTDITIAPYLSYSTHAQNGYTIGAGLNIPLDGLFDLKSRISRQKLSYKAAELEKEEKFIEMRKEIVELYSLIMSQINVLKLRAETLELATLQYNIAEKDFINGNITSSSLSSEKQRQSVALESFEKCKYEITRCLMILEVITCTSFLSK